MRDYTPIEPIDYLLIGHVTQDVVPQGFSLGGTASYSALTARAMGLRVGVVTACHPELRLPELEGIAIVRYPSEHSTTFANIQTEHGRVQYLYHRAADLDISMVPDTWRSARIVHLGPLNQEVDVKLARAFPDSFVGVTPQGWMRAWDESGLVYRKAWADAEWVLPTAQVTVFSEEDIGRDTALEARYAALSPLLVVTRASKGCTLYRRGLPALDISAPRVNVVDATGAGDVFTGTFLVFYQQSRDAIRACERATYLASQSVTRPGLQGTPRPDEVRAVMG